MTAALEFLAIIVPDLREAEEYYCELFDMKIITRETMQVDGVWYAVPYDKGWTDLDKAGIGLNMLALRRDDFVLAMFQATPVIGQIFAIGLSMTPAEIAIIFERVPKQDVVQYDEGAMLQFRDKYSFFWQIYASPYEFKSMGETTGQWLALS